MKTKWTKFKFLLPVVAFISLTSCSDDDNQAPVYIPTQNSIADVTSRNSDFSILASALVRTDLAGVLDGEGSFTVFAPTNDAFENFLDDAGYSDINQVPVAALREVLLNHVIQGKITSAQVATGYLKTMAKGAASATNTLSLYVNASASGVVLNGGTANGGAKVTATDTMADNGVIHVIDGVLTLPTVVNHAVANPDFAILVQALTRNDQPDFVGILSGNANAPFTVFAPVNTAFANLLTELSLPNLAAIPQATLENTLKYHVVAGANVLSTDLVNNMSVDTFQGGSFTVGLTGGAKITDANGRVSNITATDVQASNGVVHVLDKVLLP